MAANAAAAAAARGEEEGEGGGGGVGWGGREWKNEVGQAVERGEAAVEDEKRKGKREVEQLQRTLCLCKRGKEGREGGREEGRRALNEQLLSRVCKPQAAAAAAAAAETTLIPSSSPPFRACGVFNSVKGRTRPTTWTGGGGNIRSRGSRGVLCLLVCGGEERTE